MRRHSPTSVYNAVLISALVLGLITLKSLQSGTSDLLIYNKFVSFTRVNNTRKLFFLDSLLTVIKPVCLLVLFCILTGFIHTL